MLVRVLVIIQRPAGDRRNGKIKVLRHYFDLMTILQQIGAMGPAGTAVASRLHSAARDR